MRNKFSQEFRIQAVEKVLNRDKDTTILSISESLGIGHSTLGKWLIKAKKNELSLPGSTGQVTESRPQDLSLKERFDYVIKCASLDESRTSQFCREQGLYPHHIKQWEVDFVSTKKKTELGTKGTESKLLKQKIKKLERELRRKDKALAETAALLVLQKKVHDIWDEREDS